MEMSIINRMKEWDKQHPRDAAVREITDAQTFERLAVDGRYSQKRKEQFLETAKNHREYADKLMELWIN